MITTTVRHRPVRLTVLVALTVVAVTTAASPAVAAPTADPEGTAACPAALPDDEFGDVPARHTHEAEVDCLAWWGISHGYADGSYRPGTTVSRGQIASFLRRTFDVGGIELPAPDKDAGMRGDLVDVPDGGAHSDDVLDLIDAGLLRPLTRGKYGPSEPLRRDDMAVFLVNSYAAASGAPDLAASTTDVPFTDIDGHADADAIRQSAVLGFTNGRTATTYDPDGTVTRGQMAAFLTRLLTSLVEDADVAAPDTPSWGAVPPGRHAFLPMPDAPEGSYTFMFLRQDGMPAHWNPCETLDVRVNYTGAPSGARRAVTLAVERIAEATGIDVALSRTKLRAAGPSDHVAPDGMIVVNWPRTWPASETAIGRAPTWVRNDWIVSGTTNLSPKFHGTPDELTRLAMHELAHNMGLLHTGAPGNIMAPIMERARPATWGPGDLAGLARVGRGAGCPLPGERGFHTAGVAGTTGVRVPS